MRFHPKRWNEELWICSLHGHRAPAANVRNLRPGIDDHLGVEVGNLRLARCIRCDAWIATHAATSQEISEHSFHNPHAHAEGVTESHLTQVSTETLPEFSKIPKPRRGHDLEEAITMKLIAVWRGAHAVVFGLVAILLLVVRTNLAGWKTSATSFIETLDRVATETGRTSSNGFVVKSLQKVSNLESSTVLKLIALMVAYGVLEGVEGWGLWTERRWAEYLTVVATAGLIPFEIHELTKEVTVFRVGALILNIAVIVFLIRAKRLFGVSGGAKKEKPYDWETEFTKGPKTGRPTVDA
jgi:uncharacterized membrane protein (DUF2068 family)